MLVLTLCCVLLTIVSAEKALPSYERDPGQPPAWLDVREQEVAAVERWYVDKEDATCKSFLYLGSLGNFNNFVSKTACMYHLKFSGEEKAAACGSKKSEGVCGLKGEKAKKRWYFSKDEIDGKPYACHQFDYSGCGGNANNFDTKEECEQSCQNNVNGVMPKDSSPNSMTPVPNEFDCKFVPDIKTASPIMRVIPHASGKKCVYAAVGAKALRGFFTDLPKKQVAACSAGAPYQVESDTEVKNESEVKTYYHYDNHKALCLPYLSKTPEASVVIDSGDVNMFSTVEMCASFCPATAQVGKLKTEQPCKLSKSGEATNEDTYKIERYYYDSTDNSGDKCKSFMFSGKNINSNNFKTKAECDAICASS